MKDADTGRREIWTRVRSRWPNFAVTAWF